jgi:hypothetical protein
MTSAVSELLLAIIKLAALQVRFGLLVVEVDALSFERIPRPPPAKEPRNCGLVRSSSEPAHRSSDAEVDAAARAIKAQMLGGKDGGFHGGDEGGLGDAGCRDGSGSREVMKLPPQRKATPPNDGSSPPEGDRFLSAACPWA